MAGSIEQVLGRLEGQLQSVIKMVEKAEDSRNSTYSAIEDIRTSIVRLEGRVQAVETNINDTAPTIQEFITIKHKVVGAGILGKWLWGFGGLLLGLVVAIREPIIEWFS